MRRSVPRSLLAAVAAAVALTGAARFAAGEGAALPQHPTKRETALSILTAPVSPAASGAEQLRRGQALVAAGDCMSCHLRPGGEPLAGGLGLKTPFGTVYSANITPDPDTGIGGWTADQFYRAMHDGVDDKGRNLYPAFPYPWFRKLSRADDDAVFAYLKSLPPVHYTTPKNKLLFPLNIRFLVKGWNLLFFHTSDWQNDPTQSAEWNRGAFLVEGPGHCGACHTPKNFMGADKLGQELHGGNLDNWVAPDLTGNERTGLGRWSVDEIAEFLKTGRNVHANAGGAMAEVITYSTSLLGDDDRRAIAVYLKSRAARSMMAPTAAPEPAVMRRGAAIYFDVCSACHLENGLGQPRFFPPLGQNATLQQDDDSGLVHLILAGSRTGPSITRTSPLTMPGFAWKLSDAEIADVATFLRNSWGNHASPVSAARVEALRGKLDLHAPRLTVNSGDRR
jgi:mono/diheme cytochrome c family protein